MNRLLKKFQKQSLSDIIFEIFIILFMVIFVTLTLYPILNTLAVSLSDGSFVTRNEVFLFPKVREEAKGFFTLDHMKTVLHKDGIGRGAWVSVLRTVVGTLLALVANAFLAFIVSRKNFLFRSSLSLFWVITMYVNGGMIPTLILYKTLKLTGTFWVYVIPGAVSAFNMLVTRTYMQGIPDSLEESAQLDGAGYITIFVKIISPLCKPVYATVALFVAVYQWNSWFDVFLYNMLEKKWTTLQYELMKLLSSVTNQSGNSQQGLNAALVAQPTPQTVRAAATILTMLPIVCLYPFLQRYFVTGLTIGGVKE